MQLSSERRMSIAVGIGCLVVLGLLAETSGFTEQQQLMEQQWHDGGCKCTKPACVALGGKCQDCLEKCNGTRYRGSIYCKRPGRCVCCVPPGCKLGDQIYPDKAFTGGTCMKFQCLDGCWNYTGTIDPNCGECLIVGDPHFVTFDNHTHHPPDAEGYSFPFWGTGTYAVTQPGHLRFPQFGVKSLFFPCTERPHVTCVLCVTYYEPGITVDLCTPAPPTNCTDLSNPLCKITVYVDGKLQTIGNKVTIFHEQDGTVLVFDHLVGFNNLKCINIVGSKGLSVALCLQRDNYAYSYVWADPSFKKDPSLLYGLCDTYTGTVRSDYTLRNGSVVAGSDQAEIHHFAESWLTI